MRFTFAFLLCLASVCSLSSTARAELTITLGPYILQQNSAGQLVEIYIEAVGGELIQGINFRAQLGDGGLGIGGSDDPLPYMIGDISGPGTIFEFNNVGVFDGSAGPGYVDMGTTTFSGFQTLSAGTNLLGTLLFDTTGIVGGVWPLVLTGTAGGDTNTAGGLDLVIENGSIIVFPEPGPIAYCLLGTAGSLFFMRRYRRPRRA